mmetsp:Transcript_35930/g.101776  ORF Transcript_35930/g.101776 Transcript_35930/m.101776 type:complete len:281 (+) Transcript_35930:1529-2371(+)
MTGWVVRGRWRAGTPGGGRRTRGLSGPCLRATIGVGGLDRCGGWSLRGGGGQSWPPPRQVKGGQGQVAAHPPVVPARLCPSLQQARGAGRVLSSSLRRWLSLSQSQPLLPAQGCRLVSFRQCSRGTLPIRQPLPWQRLLSCSLCICPCSGYRRSLRCGHPTGRRPSGWAWPEKGTRRLEGWLMLRPTGLFCRWRCCLGSWPWWAEPVAKRTPTPAAQKAHPGGGGQGRRLLGSSSTPPSGRCFGASGRPRRSLARQGGSGNRCLKGPQLPSSAPEGNFWR